MYSPRSTGSAAMSPVPGVDLRLQVVALRQQSRVARRQIVQDGVQSAPEPVRLDPGARQRFLFDELTKFGGNLQFADLVPIAQNSVLLQIFHFSGFQSFP